jgi:hypothetical protein
MARVSCDGYKLAVGTSRECLVEDALIWGEGRTKEKEGGSSLKGALGLLDGRRVPTEVTFARRTLQLFQVHLRERHDEPERGSHGKRRDTDVVVASEDQITLPFVDQGGPYAMPRAIAREFERESEMILIPLSLPHVLVFLFALKGLVREGDQGTVNNSQASGEAAVGRVEEWCKGRIHFEVLRNTSVMGVITVDQDLESGIVREVESQRRMIGRASDAGQNFADQFGWVNSHRSESKWGRKASSPLGR